MKHHMVIGYAPPMEDPTPASDPQVTKKTREEGNEYIRLLRAKFGQEPVGASLGLMYAPDGRYYVVCHYMEDIKDAYIYALACEGFGPQSWMDDEKEDFRKLFLI